MKPRSGESDRQTEKHTDRQTAKFGVCQQQKPQIKYVNKLLFDTFRPEIPPHLFVFYFDFLKKGFDGSSSVSHFFEHSWLGPGGSSYSSAVRTTVAASDASSTLDTTLHCVGEAETASSEAAILAPPPGSCRGPARGTPSGARFFALWHHWS